jgi:hypothetical protein
MPKAAASCRLSWFADVPPELEWFANLGNAAARRAYVTVLKDFIRFTGVLPSPESLTPQIRLPRMENSLSGENQRIVDRLRNMLDLLLQ